MRLGMSPPYVTDVAPRPERPAELPSTTMGPVSLDVGGRQVEVTHPDKALFPGRPSGAHLTTLTLIRSSLAAPDGALRGVAGRPMILKRFVKGIDQEAI